MKKLSYRFVLGIALSVPSTVLCFGLQTESPSNTNNIGVPENAIFNGSDIDSVQMNNGGLTVSIPLVQTSGRGLSTGYRVIYNNKIWRLNEQDSDTQTVFSVRQASSWPPIRIIGPFLQSAQTGHSQYTQLCNNVPSVVLNGFGMAEADGTVHHVAPDGTGQQGCNIPPDADRYADDGSGWMNKGGSIPIRKDGLSVLTTSNASTIVTTIRDTNGNQMVSTTDTSTLTTSYVDSLGRPVPPLGYYDSDGILRTIQVQNIILSGTTQLCPAGTTCSEANIGWTVPSTITLPNGLSYSFTYESTNGQLTSITLPSGTVISYTYAEAFFGPSDPDPGGWRVKTRTVTVGGQSYTWNYSYDLSSSPETATVIDPLGNQTVYKCGGPFPGGVFQPVTTDPRYMAPCQIEEIDSYQGNGANAKLLRTVQKEYWSAEIVMPKAVTTTTYSSISGDTSVHKTRVETDYDTETIQAWDSVGNPVTAHVTRGNVTETREYSYDSAGNNPVLVRRTHLTYLGDVNPAYLAANISDRVTDKVVYDCLAQPCTAPASVGSYGTGYSGGVVVSETRTTYDGSPVVNPDNLATPPASVPGHDDADYGTAFTLRGDPTQISVWLNTTNTWLSTNNVYDTLGHLVSTTDPGGHTTTFRYSDDWNGWSANSACLPSANSFAFLTDTTNARNQRAHTTFFPCTGQVQSTKDQNDLNNGYGGTVYTYDSMKRVLSKTAYGAGSTVLAHTGYTYSDSLLDLSATETTAVTPTLSRIVKTSYDGLGRVVRTALLSDPNGITYTDTTYDALGRKASVTNPYRSTTDSTYGVTSFVYDALGRTSTTIPPDGTLTSNNVTTQFGGNYTISIDQTGRQRKRFFDSFGRVIEVDEPRSASQGSESGGSVTISGVLQNALIGNHPASPGTGSVTISGFENVNCVINRCTPDHGSVAITVNGHQDSTSFAGASTSSSIAAGLVTAINGDGAAFVFANCDDTPCTNGIVHLQARTSGAATNYSLSCSVTQQQGSFDCGTSGTTLTGGQDAAAGTTVYDAGTVTLALDGYSAVASYGNGAGVDASAAAVAADLVHQIQSQLPSTDPPFSIGVPPNGATISIGWNSPTANGNVAVTTNSTTTQTTYFSVPSFSGCGQPTSNPQPCSTTLTGGADPGPSDLNNPYVTLYKYDVLGNLLCVEQHGDATGTSCPAPSTDPNSPPVSPDPNNPWRVRQFAYDSLGRLRWSSNPESGVISFAYNAEGLLSSKTSPLPNQTGPATVTSSYSYDQLHRPTVRTYSNGDPTVTYGYDAAENTVVNGLTIHNGIGHRTSMSDGSGSAAFSYDPMDRLAAERKNIGITSPVSKNLSYTYNLDGSPATIVYPSGNTVTYTPAQSGGNTASRPGMVQDSNGVNYVTGAGGIGTYATYAPDGSIAGFLNGPAAGFSGISNYFSYNPRLQPCRIAAGTGAMPSSCIDAANHGNIFDIAYDFHLGNGNNGNVFQLINNKDNTRSQAFTYDPLNRVASGKTSVSTLWGDNYTYDAWGNLSQKTAMTGVQQAENFSQAVLPNNRLAGLAYDAAGNTVNDGIGSYVYDGENQIVSAGGVTYTYDGDGARIKKSNGRLYWFGAPGIVAESDLSGNLTAEYIFFGGERIARRDLPSGTVHYYFSDHLKSTSVVTSATGAIEEESDYHTWGEESVITHTLADQHYKFNGKERDPETGFDEFGARLYNSAWGRWLIPDWSADPTPVPYAQMDNPQSLNLYAYVLNNPTTLPDADGHFAGLLNPSPESLSQGDDHPSDYTPRWILEWDLSVYGPGMQLPVGSTGTESPRNTQSTNQVGPGQCICQLRSKMVGTNNPIAWLLVHIFMAQHTYWLVQDAQGHQHTISGGPEPPNPPNWKLNVWQTLLNDPTLTTAQNRENAKYATTGKAVFTDSSSGACDRANRMVGQARLWRQNTIPYSPLKGPNSNSAARSLGESVGLHPHRPRGAYGWDTSIPTVP